MTINLRKLRLEGLLYAAALLLALAVRIVSLGGLPLSDAEANLALIASAAAQGANPILAPHPAYLALTTALMFLFSASEWTARFWPALAGSLLALAPLLFRSRLGRLPALLMAFFLAFDPLLWGISRQVNSLPLALLSVLLAWGFWLHGRSALAGIAAAFALLSGPQVWPGIVALLAALWIDRRIAHSIPGEADSLTSAPATGDIRLAILSALVTLFLAATLFFTIPGGLSAMTGSLVSRLAGWGQPSGVSVSLLLLALVLYAFFPLVFGLWGALAGLLRSDTVDRFLVLWALLALVPALVYPARTVADLAWSVIPLWGLAARQVSRLLVLPRFDRAPALGLAILSAVILAFASMTMAAVSNNAGVGPQEMGLRLAGAGLMLVASGLLVGWGWSSAVARRGLVYGTGIVLLVYMLSAGWHAAGFSGEVGRELIGVDAPPRSTDLLVRSIDDLNRWGPQEDNGLDIVVLEVPNPSLRWLLRDYRRVSFVNALPEESQPAIVITAPRPELGLAATYRGQSLVYVQAVDWKTLRGMDWLRWLVFRSTTAPQRLESRLVLWARLDLFPGGLEETVSASEVQPLIVPEGEIAP